MRSALWEHPIVFV